MAASIGQMVCRSVRPVVVILGATGSGKSKLAIEIASMFRGEIISADSMQIYKGLDIITNKVTLEERAMCPHHLLDFVSPLHSNYSVAEFKNSALPIIDEIFERNNLPVIVGGTNYYIESLLWNFTLDMKKSKTKCGKENDIEGIESKSSEELHQILCSVDPKCGYSIHPKDRRKILSSLEVYLETGRTKSSFLAEQHKNLESNATSGPLRFSNVCMIWIQCQQKALDERINKRVDEMVTAGLIQELLGFHDRYNRQQAADRAEADYTHGIFQSIGFKEFHEYLILSEEERKSEEAEKLLRQSINDMKMVTRRYARKQIKWIVNRFLKRKGANCPLVYSVDSTNAEDWNEVVQQPAVSIVSSFLKGETPEQAPLPFEDNQNEVMYKHCHDCDRVFVTKITWEAHVSSRRHKKTVQAKKRLAEFRSSIHDPVADASSQVPVADPSNPGLGTAESSHHSPIMDALCHDSFTDSSNQDLIAETPLPVIPSSDTPLPETPFPDTPSSDTPSSHTPSSDTLSSHTSSSSVSNISPSSVDSLAIKSDLQTCFERS